VFLFIFESIGTSELLLVGIVALIFLGPRKMPEMARKIGKMMAEFRGSANEFKETWQREINFDEELKALKIDDEEDVPAKENVIDVVPISSGNASPEPVSPAIKEADPTAFEHLIPKDSKAPSENADAEKPKTISNESDKTSWL